MCDYSTLKVLSSKYRYFFDMTPVDLHFPYAGVSVDPATHTQGPLAYVLLEKLFFILIR